MKFFMKYRPYALLLLPLIMAAAVSCTGDPHDNGNSPAAGRKVEVSFRLGVKEATAPVSRATADMPADDGEGISVTYAPATREGGEGLTAEQETTVSDIWVLQFDANGNKMINQYIAAPERETDGSDVYYSGSSVLLETTAETMLFFVANAGKDVGFENAENLDDFKAMSHSFAGEAAVEGKTEAIDDNPAEEKGIVMAGRWSSPSGLNGSTEILCEMERLVSRLSIHVVNNLTETSSGIFTLISVQVQSVARRVAYYDQAKYDNNSIWRSPALDGSSADAANFFNYRRINTTFDEDDQQALFYKDLTYYITENRRGSNAAIPSQADKWRETDPSYLSTGISRATRFVIKGDYTLPATGDDVPPTRRITITTYPGDDIAANFDIVRNRDYVMNLTLNSIRDEDKRVEFNPVVTFRYYVVDGEGYTDGNPLELVTEVFKDESIGDPFIGGHPYIDYTREDVLNKYKDDLAYYGLTPEDYQDGVVFGNKPSYISADDASNTVNIIYYKNGYTPPASYTITYSLLCPGGSGHTVDEVLVPEFTKSYESGAAVALNLNDLFTMLAIDEDHIDAFAQHKQSISYFHLDDDFGTQLTNTTLTMNKNYKVICYTEPS